MVQTWSPSYRTVGAVAGAAVLLAVGPTPGAAHPPVSVVMDSRGTVYYSDLTHVWMRLPDGSRQIAVRDVHTHELWMAPGDTLYGEDVENSGDRLRHRVWKRHPDGTVTDAITWRPGYPMAYGDYAFARDGKGRAYVLRRDLRRIDVRDSSGRVVRSLAVGSEDASPGWLTVTDDGSVYVTVGSDLLRLDPDADHATVVARDLVDRTGAFDFVQGRHALMGLWTGPAGDVFVAVLAGQVVKRIAPDGTVTIAARSDGVWSPSGGMVGPDGALWVLEVSTSNDVRVRQVAIPVEPD